MFLFGGDKTKYNKQFLFLFLFKKKKKKTHILSLEMGLQYSVLFSFAEYDNTAS
jgi:hypothetical protein